MEEKEKMNPMGANPDEEKEAAEGQRGATPPDAYQQYGYPQQGQQYGQQQMYGYQQQYPQQGAYRPGAGSYPQQGNYGGYPRQNAPAAGQYNYKQGYGQQNAAYQSQGTGPGQYDFRAPSQKALQGQQGQGSGAQYPYGNYPQQYQYGQPQQAQYPYYGQQQYGSQQYQYNPQYSYGQYQAPQNNYAEMRAKMPRPPVTENGEAVIKAMPPEPKKQEEAKKPAPKQQEMPPFKNAPSDRPPIEGEIVREEITPDGKKIIVRRVVKNGGQNAEQRQDANQPSKFIQNQIKAELGEDALNGKDQPIIVYKSKMKKKPDKEGVYEPSLRDMILGPPKKEVVDRDPDPFEWKCPECKTINPDTVGTCQCGCTQRHAKAVARRQRDIEAGRIAPDAPEAEADKIETPTPAEQPMQQFRPQGQPPVQMQGQPSVQAQPVIKQDSEKVVEPVSAEQPKAEEPEQPKAPAEPEKQPEPEKAKEPEIDPEMPEKVELSEEEIKAEIDEFMSAPVQVWRPGGAKGKDGIYVFGEKKREQDLEKEKAEKEQAEKAEKEKAEKEKAEKEKVEKEKAEREKAEQAQKEASKAEEKTDGSEGEYDGLVNDSEWKCSMCGQVNSVDEKQCKCGHTRGKRAMSYQDIINASRKKPAVKKEEPKQEEKEKSSAKPMPASSKARLEALLKANSAQEDKAKAEEEARRKAEEEEAKRKAEEEEARRKAEEEARRKAEEEEARRKAEEEEAKRKAEEEEARRKAEEEASRKAEEEEARRKAEEEARRKAEEEEARRKAEEEARRKAEEEARRKAEEEARRKAEEEARRKAEEEARRKAEEEARRKRGKT